jgi:PIN domain nuclease of toxin-antitoxin system
MGGRGQTRAWSIRFRSRSEVAPGLRDNGYSELAITSEHAIAIDLLPPIHKDPFDRILVAQSTVEGITLLTADPMVARYQGSVRPV